MRKRSEAGFTLLEMLLALGLFALAGALTMPFVSRPAGDAALEATARKLVAYMRMARASAIRRNAPQIVTIDLRRRQFRADGVAGSTPIAKGISVDVTMRQSDAVAADIARLRFFPDGSSTGGHVLFRANRRSVAVDLDWMTGHAAVSRRR